MMELSLMQKIAIWVLPVIFAITVHEVAHGWMANRLGDPTARLQGRLTLNPIKHIDPIGTLLVPLVMIVLTSFVFGWAKPVPVDNRQLRNPRRDMALVAAAGPGANLVMAVLWALVAKLGYSLQVTTEWAALPLILMGSAGIFINLLLMVLNLLPIPPLDGGRILMSLLPPRAATTLGQLEPYGFIILLVLLFTGVLGQILMPMLQALSHLMHWIATF